MRANTDQQITAALGFCYILLSLQFACATLNIVSPLQNTDRYSSSIRELANSVLHA